MSRPTGADSKELQQDTLAGSGKVLAKSATQTQQKGQCTMSALLGSGDTQFMRTANSIEAQKSVKTPKSSPARGTHPRSLQNLRPPWKPGECPNPSGKPKHDVASSFARAVIKGSLDAAFLGFIKQLAKGNAYAFTQLAERGYGKLLQKHELTGKDGGPLEISEISDTDLNKRIADLERDLGLARAIDQAGEIRITDAGKE